MERFSRQLFTIFSRKFVLSTSTPMCGICVMYFYSVNQVAGHHPRCVKSIELGRCCHFMVVSCCVLLPRVVSCLRAVHPAASVSLWRRMNQRRNCCSSSSPPDTRAPPFLAHVHLARFEVAVPFHLLTGRSCLLVGPDQHSSRSARSGARTAAASCRVYINTPRRPVFPPCCCLLVVPTHPDSKYGQKAPLGVFLQEHSGCFVPFHSDLL